MTRKRIIGVLDETGHAGVVTGDMPPLEKGNVLVRVYASLISAGTELKQGLKDSVKSKRAAKSGSEGSRRPFGYQNAGEIIEVGEGAGEFTKGERVACMGGGYALHSNYAAVPKNLCCRLPENVSYGEGAFAHLAATSLHAVRRGKPELGEFVLVTGLGLVGNMAAQLSRLSGAYTAGWDMFGFRCETAKKAGIDEAAVVDTDDSEGLIKGASRFTVGRGFDMAVIAYGGDATGTLGMLRRVMRTAEDSHQVGRICIVGGVRTDINWPVFLGNMDVRACSRTGPGYHDKEWERGFREYPRGFIRWNTRTNMELALRLISEGRLDVKSLITHEIPLEDIDSAVAAHTETPGQTLGTVLTMKNMD